MIYVHVIHVCLDVALMEGDLRPSVISKEHLPTSAAYSHHPHMCKNILPTIESKNAKTSLLVYMLMLLTHV